MYFLTLNVCGLRDVNKRMSLMQWLCHLNLDIVCLQEIHVVSRGGFLVFPFWFSRCGVSGLCSFMRVGYSLTLTPNSALFLD